MNIENILFLFHLIFQNNGMLDLILLFTDINIPAFSGQSYIELKPLKAYHKFSVEIEFKTYTDNGILLYSQQRTDGSGDFISLALVNG